MATSTSDRRPTSSSDSAFVNAAPALVANVIRYRRRNPCGDVSSALPGFSADMTHLGEVRVPVLIAAGGSDVAFASTGVRHQRAFFTGSNDVTVKILANTGHFPMFERSAPRFRALVSNWLRRHTPIPRPKPLRKPRGFTG